MDKKEPTSRKRSATMLSLAWLADQVRKATEVKKKIEAGVYSIDSEAIARALVLKEAHHGRAPPK